MFARSSYGFELFVHCVRTTVAISVPLLVFFLRYFAVAINVNLTHNAGAVSVTRERLAATLDSKKPCKFILVYAPIAVGVEG